MPENPLKPIEDLDPGLLGAVESNRKLATSEGAIPSKYKYLIAMVLDATHGAEEGVRSFAGAAKEEIAEALRVAYLIDGVGCIYTASRALSGLI